MSARRLLAVVLAGGALHATCSPALPSTRPLGGVEEPDASADARADAPAEASARPAEPAPPVAQPSAAPAASSAPPSTSAAPPAASSSTAAPACDDGGPPPRSCDGLVGPAGRSDCFFAPAIGGLCGMLAPLLKPKVAASFVGCLHGRSGTDALCKMDVVLECARPAFDLACVDPKMPAFCAEVTGRCKDPPGELREYFTVPLCTKAMSSLLPIHRAKIEACMRTSCDLDQCMSSLLAPPSGAAPPPPPSVGPPPGFGGGD